MLRMRKTECMLSLPNGFGMQYFNYPEDINMGKIATPNVRTIEELMEFLTAGGAICQDAYL